MSAKGTIFSFDQKTTNLLETIRQSSQATNKSEVIRSALKLYNVANKAKIEHKRLIIRDDSTGIDIEIII